MILSMQTAFAACKQSFATQQKKVATISKKKVAGGKKKVAGGIEENLSQGFDAEIFPKGTESNYANS